MKDENEIKTLNIVSLKNEQINNFLLCFEFGVKLTSADGLANFKLHKHMG